MFVSVCAQLFVMHGCCMWGPLLMDLIAPHISLLFYCKNKHDLCWRMRGERGWWLCFPLIKVIMVLSPYLITVHWIIFSVLVCSYLRNEIGRIWFYERLRTWNCHFERECLKRELPLLNEKMLIIWIWWFFKLSRSIVFNLFSLFLFLHLHLN